LTACFAAALTIPLSPSAGDVFSLADKNYVQLQQALPRYQQAAAHPWPVVLEGEKALRPGMKSLRVLALRSRLQASGELLAQDNWQTGLDIYDTALALAVSDFQASHGLKPDGIAGKDTLYELNIPAQQRLQQIRASLSRWAHLSRELGDRYMLVNIPAYQFMFVDHGRTVLSMKAIVGKPERPTPEIESAITRIVFNPYWNVPKLIAQKDIVPKVINDPDYLEEMHIKIVNREADNVTEIPPEEIDWEQAAAQGFKYYFRQEPGKSNALGLIKFEFENSHDVYMHDTPAKNLFAADKRAFSSGCIRIERPFALVPYLMQDNFSWNDDKIQAILANEKTRYINAATPVPIIIAYLTVWVDDHGKLQFRDDIYKQDTM
jgi:murein L,D-transpeptidase YcbB/YkuD